MMVASPAIPVLALTGTPGTGKSTLTLELMKQGYARIDLNELVEETDPGASRDEARDSLEVDLAGLAEKVRARLLPFIEQSPSTLPGVTPRGIILEGHLSHELGLSTHILVLRCGPAELRKRLERRGYQPEKVAENCEAEALDIIVSEALAAAGDAPEMEPVFGKPKVRELDTSAIEPAQAVGSILAWLGGEADTLQLPGTARWLATYLEV